MEGFFLILVIIGLYTTVLVVTYIVEAISKLLEIRKYKAKLKKIAPQLKTIDIEKLSAKMSSVKTNYLSLEKFLRQHYKVGNEEESKDICKYVQKEANYRRRIRKSRQRTNSSYRRY
jgi:uncharacterized membrane protein YgaE (UPF0421/DUF939 family)